MQEVSHLWLMFLTALVGQWNFQLPSPRHTNLIVEFDWVPNIVMFEGKCCLVCTVNLWLSVAKLTFSLD